MGKVRNSEMEDTPEDRKDCDFSTTDNPVPVSLSQADHTALSCTIRLGESGSQPHSHSIRSLSQIPCTEKKASSRAERSHSLNDVKQYTPDIFVEGNKESYWLHCTQAGLFQCKVTGLVFKMEAKGDVIYRTVPWNQMLLAQLGKRPAGPLFDIKRHQGSVCQLHLPHCEILPPGGGKSLIVHVMDEKSELIVPKEITETHVIIEVTAFSAYGVVNDVNSPNPKRALVSLFYTPPIDDNDPISILKVLLLPGNVVLTEVINKRREIHGEEIYIERPPCNLIPKQEYTLSTSTQDDAITIEPSRATFEVDEYHNCISTFYITLKERFEVVRLLLSNSITSACAWECCVNFAAPDLRRQLFKIQVQLPLKDTAEDKLFSVRSSFIDRVSPPVLNSLLDKLLEERVLNDAETEEAVGMQLRNEKARSVIDTVRRKGPGASSSMISLLCELDPFLSKLLGLDQHQQPRRSPDGAGKERTQPRMKRRKRRIPS